MCSSKTMDVYEMSFGSFEDLLASAKETDKDSRWERYPIKELRVEVLPDAPLCVQDFRDELDLAAAVDDATIQDAMSSTGLVIKVNGQNELIRDTAVRGVLSRARINGSALKKVEKTEFCNIVNTCFKVWNDKALVLVRHGKVTALHAGDEKDYSPMPIPELLTTLKNTLDVRFPGNVFRGGNENHSLTTLKFDLPNQKKELLSEYEKTVAMHGTKVISLNLIPGITFCTSDTGNSGANVYALLCDRRYPARSIRIGTAIKLEHRSGSGIQEFEDNLKMLYGKFIDQTKRLSDLLDVQIQNPVACLKRVAKKLTLPAKQSAEAIQLYVDTGDLNAATAHELYMALYETTFLCKAEGVSELKIHDIEESTARALALDWKKFDYPEAKEDTTVKQAIL